MDNKKRLHILFLTAWYPNTLRPREGTFVVNHAKAVQQFNDVTVLYPYDPNPQSAQWKKKFSINEEYGLRTIRIPYQVMPIPGITYVRHILRLRAVVRNLSNRVGKPDVIHANVYDVGLAAIILAKVFSIPVVLTEHSTVFTRNRLGMINKLKAKFVMNSVDAVLPVSNELKNAIKILGVKNRIEVIPNSVNVDTFSLGKAADKKNIKNILSVTSLRPVKGISYLLKALANVLEKRNDFFLTIVGDGPHRDEYTRLTKNLNLQNNVTFRGSLDNKEVALQMKKCSFFVQASLDETFGVVYIEAMACGKPIVATSLPPLIENVTEERGILVPPKNVDTLSNALLTMLDTYDNYNPGTISKYVQQKYSYTVIGSQFDVVYQSILHKK